MNFQRGKNPKESLGLGGIDLQKKYDETVGEWRKYFSAFIGRVVKFKVDKFLYSNWDHRVQRGELFEWRTMRVKEVSDQYSGNPGHLYFIEEESKESKKCPNVLSNQCWFIDMSEKIYILE